MFFLRLLIGVGAGALGFYAGRTIGLSDQWPYFEALRTTSSIIFGVMGALLAIVYPEVVKQGFRATRRDDPGSAGNLRLIVDPLAHSALLLLAVVLIGPAFAWVNKQYGTLNYVMGACFGVLMMLTTWQTWILLLVLRPLDLLRSHTERAAAVNAVRKRIHSFADEHSKKSH
ncbi:hypothetical protein [Burkholderia vietnamiensis]|uniref:hypothetical protein n=1 Tax=Burkholderia vietnamiensis TaxID=60552 RepID=UPI001588E38F|nr:hypothetical protein [Burkholderia vietnamiensis]